MLKNKSDVFQRFHDFQHHVELLFDRKILALQTDWGGEYQKLNSFFQRVGMSHHVSCPHAHQQNGSAERKHRHIVEVGLSLLAYASMPLKFWDEAFQTAVFLINRPPSQVIENQTLIERLFKHKGDYSFLRIFGCACWPNLLLIIPANCSFAPSNVLFLAIAVSIKAIGVLTFPLAVYISRGMLF
jgi:histone deacetylase 1/2